MAKWENGALNEVAIEGILSEVKLQEGQDKNGNPAIFGEYKIRTSNTIDGIEYNVEIPVRVYQSKITKNKKDNPAYAAAEKIMKDYVSIAAGGVEKATAVRLPEKSTSLQENFFMSKTTNQMVFGSGIRASFINEINKADMTPGASFKAIVVIGELTDEVTPDGEETGRLILKGVLPQWGGRVDVIDFIVANRRIADHVRNNWQKGDTVLIGGRINFTSVVESAPQSENTFGEVMSSSKTKSIREYIITGGHEEPLTEEEGAYAMEDIAEALQERQSRIETAKSKAAAETRKPAPSFGF